MYICMQDPTDKLRLSTASTAAELDPHALPGDSDEGPLLLTSASPVGPQLSASTARAATAASRQPADHVRLSGTGQGMMTVVRTHFVPLSDSLSDSDSDSEVSAASFYYFMVRPLYASQSVLLSKNLDFIVTVRAVMHFLTLP